MATTEQSKHVLTELEDGILRIQMNRPEKKNALTSDMYAAMVEALRRADEDGAIRVALITGTPDLFTSGNDVMDFMNNPPTSEEAPVHQFLRHIAIAKTPIVAAVNGLAIGIGTTMLLHCDLAYAGKGARFQMPFVNLGLCPEAASSFLLPQTMGHRQAAELLLLGQSFDAPKARSLGIINEVLDDNEVASRARERALELAAQPSASLRLTKALMKRPFEAAVLDQMNSEGGHFKERLVSPEAAEAFQAFAQKRKPDFSQFT